MCVSVSAVLEEPDVKRRDGFKPSQVYRSMCEGPSSINRWESTRKMTLCRCPCTAGRWKRPVAPSAGWEAPEHHTHEPTDSENYTHTHVRSEEYYSTATLVCGQIQWLFAWADLTWCQYPDRWSQRVKIESETRLGWTTITKNKLVLSYLHSSGITWVKSSDKSHVYQPDSSLFDQLTGVNSP